MGLAADQRLHDWNSLRALLVSGRVKAIAIDLRGTLISPPRGKHLTRCAAVICPDQVWPVEVDEVVPKGVLDKHRSNTQIYDWSLLTVLEWSEYGGRNGLVLDAANSVRAYQHLRDEYFSKSRLLVDDIQLEHFILSCKQLGMRVVICADGFVDSETAVFRKCFPRSSSIIDGVFGSDSCGTNKLSSSYYVSVAAALKIDPEGLLVVGDRLDKDIRFAEEAGCSGLLVSDEQQGTGPWTPSLCDVLPSPEPKVRFGAVFGRFQPFHLEHLRLVLAGLARVEKLFIGVTQPFDDLTREPGDHRTAHAANPLPFWLRMRAISLALSDLRIPEERFQILPCPLGAESIRRLFPPGTVGFSTVFDDWGDQKEKIIEHGGLTVQRLELGAKTMTGSEIRDMIRHRDRRWKALVPAVIVRELAEEIENFVIGNDQDILPEPGHQSCRQTL